MELGLHRGDILTAGIRGALLLRWIGGSESSAEVVEQKDDEENDGEGQEE